MGTIVYKALLRTAAVIALVWYLADNFETPFLWIIAAAIFYLAVIHPAITQWKTFQEKRVKAMENSLCATCRHYDPTAVLCMKYDKHPEPNKIPCNGNDWEPKQGTF